MLIYGGQLVAAASGAIWLFWLLGHVPILLAPGNGWLGLHCSQSARTMNASIWHSRRSPTLSPRPEFPFADRSAAMHATFTLPKCPSCGDAGNVNLLEIDASSVFKPLPEGWGGAIAFLHCKACGWTGSAAKAE